MAKLAIEITADARKAVNSFEATTTSLGKLRTELASAQNEQVKGVGSTKQLEDATEAYLNKIQRQESAMMSGSLSAKDLEKALNRLSNEQKKLSAIMDSNESVDKVFSDMKTYYEGLKDELEVATTKQMEFEKQSRLTANAQKQLTDDNAALAYYDLIGDELGKASKQLDIYERKLRETIRTNGKDSKEARKLADSIKTQKVAIDGLAKASRKATPSVKGLFKEFVKGNIVASGVESALRKAVQVFVEAGKVAAHAEETINLFNTTFENIQNVADKTASTIQSKMGIANSSAKEALGIFGDLALGYGQTQSAALDFAESAVKTTLDLISFKNIEGDTVEIMRNFSSGLVGNYENFKKLGIIVTATEIDARLAAKGLQNLTGASAQFARAQEALLIVQEKSKNATGDMEKTLNSTANVTRRVQEENKTLMENLGRHTNNVLNPLRKMWLEIASAINRAEEAQKQYNAGNKDIKVLDVENKFFDRAAFTGQVAQIRQDFVSDKSNPFADLNQLNADTSAKLKEIMIKFGVEAETVINEINSVAGQYNTELVALIDSVSESVENEKRLQAEKDKRTEVLETELSSAQSLIDALNGITGVSVSQSFHSNLNNIDGISNYATTTGAVLNSIDGILSVAISEAISSIDSATWGAFSDDVSLALGTATEKSGLEQKLAAVKSLYELLNSESLKDGLVDDKEEEQLKAVAKIFEGINEDLKGITEEQKRIASLDSILGNVDNSTASMINNTAKIGMNDMDAALYDLKVQKDLALSYAKTDEEISEVNKKFKDLEAATTEYYNTLEKQNKKLPDLLAGSMKASDLKGDWKSYLAGINSPSVSSGAYGNSPASKALYDQIMKEGKEEFDSLCKIMGETNPLLKNFGITSEEAMQQLSESAKEAADALDEANWEALGDMATSKLGGEIGDMVLASLGKGSTGNVGADWIGILIDIASQLEVVQEINSLISDAIVPVLDAFLAPILPLIEMISEFISSTFGLLETVFPIWKAVVATVTYIIGSILNGVMFLYDGIKYCFDWLWNKLAMALDKIIIGDQSHWQKELHDPIEALVDRQGKINEVCDKIMATEMKIEHNTRSDDAELRAYEKMFQQGLLSVDEYSAMIAAYNGEVAPDLVKSMGVVNDGYSDYRAIDGKVVANNNAFNVTINGSGLSEEQLQRAIVRGVTKAMAEGGSFAYA